MPRPYHSRHPASRFGYRLVSQRQSIWAAANILFHRITYDLTLLYPCSRSGLQGRPVRPQPTVPPLASGGLPPWPSQAPPFARLRRKAHSGPCGEHPKDAIDSPSPPAWRWTSARPTARDCSSATTPPCNASSSSPAHRTAPSLSTSGPGSCPHPRPGFKWRWPDRQYETAVSLRPRTHHRPREYRWSGPTGEVPDRAHRLGADLRSEWPRQRGKRRALANRSREKRRTRRQQTKVLEPLARRWSYPHHSQPIREEFARPTRKAARLFKLNGRPHGAGPAAWHRDNCSTSPPSGWRVSGPAHRRRGMRSRIPRRTRPLYPLRNPRLGYGRRRPCQCKADFNTAGPLRGQSYPPHRDRAVSRKVKRPNAFTGEKEDRNTRPTRLPH
jgi:hypothetical protein